MAAALPNTQHYDSDLAQYRYARTVTGSFPRLEPHELYRQVVERSVEPGDSWPDYGAPRRTSWNLDERIGRAIADRVRQIIHHIVSGDPVPAGDDLPLIPEPIYGVGVSLYSDGLLGCWMGYDADLDKCLVDATSNALRDPRYTHKHPASCANIAAIVSLLYGRQVIGYVSPEQLKLYFGVGRHTLSASGQGRSGLVLAHFPVHEDWDGPTYIQRVLRKAGLPHETAHWTSFETVAWSVVGDRSHRLSYGFQAREPSSSAGAEHYVTLIRRLVDYLGRQRCGDGLPAYFSVWSSGSQYEEGTATRILLALTGLLEARGLVGGATCAQAPEAVGRFVEGAAARSPRPSLTWDSGSDAQLLSNICLLDRPERYAAATLAARLRPLIHSDGAIYSAVHGRITADLDFLSGSVLLALARASHTFQGVLDALDLSAILEWYRRRFTLVQPWGMVWWHAQAWSALADPVPGVAAFVFQLVDWALARQSARSGAFLIDDFPPHTPSFLSGCVLEGVADAWALAQKLGDASRVRTYESAWRRGVALVERLIVSEDDALFSADPTRSAGGVRATFDTSGMRIDYAGHLLVALSKGARCLAA